MKIKKLTIKNFLAIGEEQVVSLEDRGLVLIQGDNRFDSSSNSNGVGKSSIADALCWVLYGVTARGKSGDGVVNRFEGKNCAVTVEIEEGSMSYRITRYRKDSKHKNATFVYGTVAGSGEVDMSKGTERETQVVINDIIGCSLEVFAASIYAGQEKMPDLPSMTDKQLKMIIEEAAGSEELERAYEIARDEATIAAAEHAATVVQIDRLKLEIPKAELEIVEYEVRAKAHENTVSERVKLLTEQREKQDAELKATALKIKAEGDSVMIAARIAEIRTEMSGQRAFTKAATDALMALNGSKNKQRIVEEAITKWEQEIAETKHLLENSAEYVSKPCPACGKTGDAHDEEAYIAHLKKLITQHEKKMSDLLEALEVAKKKVAESEVAYEKAESEVPDVTELTNEAARLQAKMDKITELNNTLARSIVVRKNLDDEISRESIATNPYLELIEKKKHALAAQEKALKEYGELLLEKEKRVEITKAVVKVFSPAGVRAHILDTVTPFLNERTGEYLSVLSDGNISATWTTLTENAKGELKEKFSIEATNSKGDDSFSGLSGGQKRKVRLATMLALQDLVAARASKPIELWIGDEIDDALDVAGLERLMTILERKARERGTVLIISHNELKDWCDSVLDVILDTDGYSRFEGAL